MTAALRKQILPLLLLGGLAALYLPWTASERLGSLGGDSAVYLLTAEHFAPYLPDEPVAAAFADASQFPPLYPAALAATGGAASLRVAHAVTTLFLLAALAAAHALLRELSVPPGKALVAVTAFALMPGTLEQALQLKSEPLYLALSLAGLVALLRAGTSGSQVSYWLAVALMAGALLTRSAGIALVPALWIALWRGRPAGWPWMAAAMPAPALAWAVLHRGEDNYAGVLLQTWLASPGAAIDTLAGNAAALVAGLGSSVVAAPALALVLAPLAVIAAGVLVLRAGRGAPDAWYVAAYLALVTVWGYRAESARFAWVMIPLLLAYVVQAGWMLAQKLPPSSRFARSAAAWLAPAALAVAVMPQFAIALERWHDPAVADRELVRLPEWYGRDRAAARAEAQAHLDLVRALAALARHVPAGDCVFAIKPSTVAYHLRRDAFLTPFEAVDDDAFQAWLLEKKCRHMVLLAATDGEDFPTPYYPRDRLGDALEIVAAVPGSESPAVVAALARLKD
jgi:hypothetical protein